MTTLLLTGEPLSISDVVAVARAGRRVALAPEAVERIERARALVETIVAEQQVCYGVTTGFGALSKIPIPAERLGELQHNLVRSHAAGVGAPLPANVVRAMLLLTAASIARGASGVRRAVVEGLLALLNHDITPYVPSRGSVGASGDLAPLAHIALVLIGEGQASIGLTKDERPTTNDIETSSFVLPPSSFVPGAEALARAGLCPLQLEAKEGLALLNGTHLMAGLGALLVHDSWRLLRAAEVAAAMSLEGALGTHAALDARIHALRPQPGQAACAARLRDLLRGSTIPQSHRDDPRVQDPYSLRCIPQVLGAARDALAFAEQVIGNELGAVTDNPLLFAEDQTLLSGGNFHGQPLATALDLLAITLAQIAGFSERRSFLLLSAWEPEMHLTPFLTPQPGVQSGLMIVQYTAAALVAEIRALAQPASIASLPTSAGMEDWNSMGATSALQAQQALNLARDVVAIELLCAAQALEQHRPLRSGACVETTYERLRARVPALTADRPPAPDIAALAGMIGEGEFEEVELSAA
ncbi:MAG TPA: histidine ammonia-lyase [Roseiflexaceae bacterium]|nr:histidine ammonia-lyase [Roseiflexaceae bacterium]